MRSTRPHITFTQDLAVSLFAICHAHQHTNFNMPSIRTIPLLAVVLGASLVLASPKALVYSPNPNTATTSTTGAATESIWDRMFIGPVCGDVPGAPPLDPAKCAVLSDNLKKLAADKGNQIILTHLSSSRPGELQCPYKTAVEGCALQLDYAQLFSESRNEVLEAFVRAIDLIVKKCPGRSVGGVGINRMFFGPDFGTTAFSIASVADVSMPALDLSKPLPGLPKVTA